MVVLLTTDQESEESKPLGISYYLKDKHIIIRRDKAMYISTAHFDEILIDLDPEEDPMLYNLAQGLRAAVSDISVAILELDSRIDDLEKRLT